MFRRVSESEVLEQLSEPDVVIKQRKKYKETMSVLKQAKKLLVKDSK